PRHNHLSFAAAYFLQFGIQKSAVPPQSRKAAWPGRICPLELISSNAFSSPKESPQCRAPDLAVRSTRLRNGSPTFSVSGWDCRRRWLRPYLGSTFVLKFSC